MPKTSDNVSYIKKYTEEKLEKAIEAVKRGIPKREACRQFNIPRATLQFRLSNKFVKRSHGPMPILTFEEESILVKWIQECHRKGFPRRQEDVQASVKQFLDDTPRKNPFPNNYPGIGWYKAFMRRHPELSVRKPEGVTNASAKVSETDIKKWFQQIEFYLKEKDYCDILRDPSRIFNADETNFQLCPQNKKVLAPKGTKNVYEVDCGKSKANLTVLFTFSAAGETTPPLIIYPYKRMPRDIADSIPEGFTVSCSDTGWMKTELFFEYIANCFYPQLKSRNIKFPVILYVDGHKTHLDRKLSEICSKFQIILIALYPNATRILQPADVSTFKPLKDGWRKGVIAWRRLNPNAELTKREFAPLLKCVLDKTLNSSIIINGFRACGLFPWNCDAIDFSKCLGKNSGELKITKNEISNTITLDLQQFTEMVGMRRIKMFEDMNHTDENSDFFILYKIWKHFYHNENSDLPRPLQHSLTDICVVAKNGMNESTKIEEELSELPSETLNNIVVEINDIDNENGTYVEEIDISQIPVVYEENGELVSIPQSSFAVKEMINDPDGKITNYLRYYNTPERKGIKETEKVPYIISSSVWKQYKDNKENEKQRKIQELEKRKKEREEKKILKENMKKERETTKKTKQTGTKTNRKRKYDIPLKSIQPENKIKILSDIILNEGSETLEKEKNVNSLQEGGVQKIKRNICFDSPPESKVQNYLNDIPLQSADILFENEQLLNALCYSCTMNINSKLLGIKCNLCSRSYHLKCIEKHSLHKSNSKIFTCSPCLHKMNSF